LFGLFKKKPTDPFEIVLDELGKMSAMIQKAAKERDDLSLAMSGTAAVSSIISVGRSHLGLSVQPETIFAQFLAVVEKQDFGKIIEMTKSMDGTLSQISKNRLKGAALLYWFNGDQ